MLFLYEFRPISDILTLRTKPLSNFPIKFRDDEGLCLVAPEGINGQSAVPTNELDRFKKIRSDNLLLTHDLNLGDIVPSATPTFDILIVRTRDPILRDGSVILCI